MAVSRVSTLVATAQAASPASNIAVASAKSRIAGTPAGLDFLPAILARIAKIRFISVSLAKKRRSEPPLHPYTAGYSAHTPYIALEAGFE